MLLKLPVYSGLLISNNFFVCDKGTLPCEMDNLFQLPDEFFYFSKYVLPCEFDFNGFVTFVSLKKNYACLSYWHATYILSCSE